MAETTSDRQTPTIDWEFWFQWLLATTVGWAIGWTLIGEIGVGVVVGIAQWFVLRRLGHQAGWWIWATTVGWAVGWAMIVAGVLGPPVTDIIVSLVSGAVLGGLVGFAQWLLLRRLVSQAGWWIPVSAVSWAIGLSGIFGGTVVGAVVGAATGLMLDWLLRHSGLEM